MLNRKDLFSVILFSASLVLISAVFLFAFRNLPIENTTLGLDWRTIWEAVYRGKVTYGNTGDTIGGFYTPPWGVLLLWPLGFLSFRDSWAIISLLTIIALVLSVPRTQQRRLDFIAILLLVLSFPSLRNLADGNLEGLVIAGLALLIYGFNHQRPYIFAIGILLATVKFQETWLLVAAILILSLFYWPIDQKIKSYTLIGSIIVLSMVLWGRPWISSLFSDSQEAVGLSSEMGRGSLIDITLSAALGRLGAPSWFTGAAWLLLAGATLWFSWQTPCQAWLSWSPTTLLLSASMLLSPYVSGNSYLTLLALSVIPLFQENRLIGAMMIGLAYLPYFMTVDLLYYYQSYYWTGLIGALWFLAGYRTYAQTRSSRSLAK